MGDNLVRVLGLFVLLLLVRCLFVVVIDLDGVWEVGLLTWVRSACPLVHALETANRIAIALATQVIGWQGFQISKPIKIDEQKAKRNPLAWCKRAFGFIFVSEIFLLFQINNGYVFKYELFF